MTGGDVRPVAVGIVRRDDEVLVEECVPSDVDAGSDCDPDSDRDPRSDFDADSADPFYRPVGGGIEFGELGREALEREFREELGLELTNVAYLETYEDVFEAAGEVHHELWRTYRADFAADWPYDRDVIEGYEPDTDTEFVAKWKPLSALASGDETFYPEEVLGELSR